MNDKNIKALLIILVIVGGIWLGQYYLNRNTKSMISTEGKLDLPGRESEIKRVVINQNGKLVAIQKKDNIWFLETDQPLGQVKAKELDANTLVNLLEPKDTKVVSNNSNKHKELGLDKDIANSVAFYNDSQSADPVLVLLFSKSNPKLFRQSEMTNVYEASGDLSRIISQSNDMWIAPSPTPTVNEASSSSL